MDLSVVPCKQLIVHQSEQQQADDSIKARTQTRNDAVSTNAATQITKYRECLRNHAASIGGHAHDGCGEFMPLAANNKSNSLTCAACGCHRNFHRRELPSGGVIDATPYPYVQPPLLLYRNAVNVSPSNANNNKNLNISTGVGSVSCVTGTVHSRYDDYDRRSEAPERDLNVGPRRVAARNKRFRTKFTTEQKEKMLEFAERAGWRINRQDDVALNRFCEEIGIKRNVLKVWMHNNKNAHRRRECSPQPPPVAAHRQPIGV